MIDLSKQTTRLRAVPGSELEFGDTVRVKYLPSNEIINATFLRHVKGQPWLVLLQHETFAVANDPDLWQMLGD